MSLVSGVALIQTSPGIQAVWAAAASAAQRSAPHSLWCSACRCCGGDTNREPYIRRKACCHHKPSTSRAVCRLLCVCVRVCVFRVWHIIESVLGRSWRNDSQLSKTGSASCAPQVYKNEVGCSGLLLPRLGARL